MWNTFRFDVCRFSQCCKGSFRPIYLFWTTFLQCCGSGMFIPDPDFYRSQIPDPDLGSKNSDKSEGWKKNTFFVATNFTKFKIIYFLMLKKKFWPILTKIIELFTPKIVTSSQKYGLGIRDPRSGKNLFRIPDPRVKKALDPGSGSATLLFCGQECIRHFCEMWPIYYFLWDIWIRAQRAGVASGPLPG